jgi:hypothetical protein
MKRRILILTAVLGIAGCGGSDPRPANDPASVNTTAAPAETTSLTPAASRTLAARDARLATTGVAAQGTDRPNAGPTTTPSPRAIGTPDPNTNVQPASGATVVTNPGVADQTKDATNTKINERDRHGALTPMDQGGSAAERNITAAIRKGVVGDKSLSFTAKNVKIITTGTKVTLRGPVKTDEERSVIENRAKQTPGVTEVDNQLEVNK